MKLTARTDWQPHTKDDFSEFSTKTKGFAEFLLDRFDGTDYSIVWANDFSEEPCSAKDHGEGDRQFIGWFEIKGPIAKTDRKGRIAYLRLHLDGHIEASRSDSEFLNKYEQQLREYTGGKLYVSKK